MIVLGFYVFVISWEFLNFVVVSIKGVVICLVNGEDDVVVILIVIIILEGLLVMKMFEVIVCVFGLLDLVVYYSFDNEDLIDVIGNFDVGIIIGVLLMEVGGVVVYVDGIVGKVLDLDGMYGVQLLDNLIGDNIYVIFVWFNLDLLVFYLFVFFGYVNIDSWISMILGGYYGVSNVMVWFGIVWYDVFIDQVFEIGFWYYMVMVNNQGDMMIYINGEEGFSGVGFLDVFLLVLVMLFLLGVNFWDVVFNG